MFDVGLELASCIIAADVKDGIEKLLTTAPPAAATIAAGFRSVCRGEKLSSSSSSIGLLGVIATVSLKHKHAQ